jgi:DNA-binding MarR family transcriptional regulator
LRAVFPMGNGERAAAKAHDLLFVIAHELLTVGVKLNGALLRVFGAQKTGYTAYVILKILHADGAASQKQLAWRLGRKSATLTEPVLRLMMLGFVEAGKPAHDRRVKLLRITPAGRDYLDEATRELSAELLKFFTGIPETDLGELDRIVGKVRRANERMAA